MPEHRPGPAAPDGAVVLEGEVADGVCFANGVRGPDHKLCALTCFKRGEAPMLIADSGDGYVLIADHGRERLLDDAKATAGDHVRLTGFVRERYGVKSFSITAVAPAPALAANRESPPRTGS